MIFNKVSAVPSQSRSIIFANHQDWYKTGPIYRSASWDQRIEKFYESSISVEQLVSALDKKESIPVALTERYRVSPFADGLGHTVVDTELNITFFCIDKHKQKGVNFDSVRQDILSHLDLKGKDVRFLQLVGGMMPMGASGQEKVYTLMQELVSSHEHIVIQSGFSGYVFTPQPGSQWHDVDVNTFLLKYASLEKRSSITYLPNMLNNHVVSHMAASHTHDTFGNIHASACYLTYDAEAPQQSLYAEKATVRYGSDVHSSDNLADSLLMLGGGIQSFKQLCNMLLKAHINDIEPAIYIAKGVKGSGLPVDVLSAPELIEHINVQNAHTVQEVMTTISNYFTPITLSQSLRTLFDRVESGESPSFDDDQLQPMLQTPELKDAIISIQDAVNAYQSDKQSDTTTPEHLKKKRRDITQAEYNFLDLFCKHYKANNQVQNLVLLYDPVKEDAPTKQALWEESLRMIQENPILISLFSRVVVK